MIKKLIKKVKDFWYSTEGIMTMAIAAIMASLTAILIGPVTVFTYIGAVNSNNTRWCSNLHHPNSVGG